MLNDPIPLAARQSSSTAKAQNIPFGLHVVLRRKYSKQHAGISFHLHDVFKTRKVGDTTKPDSQSNTVLQYSTSFVDRENDEFDKESKHNSKTRWSFQVRIRQERQKGLL